MSALSPLEAAFLVGEPPLRDWKADERPRERLQQNGVRALSEAELIALLLRTGTRGGTALALGRRVQQLAAGLGGLDKLELSDLQGLPGLGLAKAASLLAALEWGRRQTPTNPEIPPLRTGRDVYVALKGLLEGRREENFAVLALDARRRVQASQVVSQGTLTQALAHPREVFRVAIKLNAAAVAVGHNHPSGDCRPSPEDHGLTLRLRECGELLAVPLLDHIIVGAGAYFSYAEQGWPRA
jgi:DNA repair protein RadC